MSDIEEKGTEEREQFFLTLDSLLDFIVEYNDYLSETYDVKPINSFYLMMFESFFRPKLENEEIQVSILEEFGENFDSYAYFDKYKSRDIEFYKKVLLNEVLARDDIPNIVKSQASGIVEEMLKEEYLEEEHLNTLHIFSTKLISNALTWNYLNDELFTVKDKRWDSLLSKESENPV